MIQVKNLNKSYERRRGDHRVLRDVTLTLPDTGFVCILGPSGCGKTSLLNAVGGLDKFDNGTIITDQVSTNRYGKRLFEAERNRSFGYIFQNYYLLSDHSVGYNVYLGLHSLKLSHEEKLDRVEEALKAVEMERYFHRNVSDLSGGQQQRVAIARALARKPRVIFADEPTGNLDEANTRNICALLRKISKTNLVVMVTHEQQIARFFADRIISLDNGVITEDTDSFTRGTLSNADALYTGDFMEQTLQSDGIRVRYYRQENCGGVDVSILALKDRIVIKLSDGRTISCGQTGDQPVLVEGVRPEMTLEELEQGHLSWQPGENVPARAGRGVRLGDMFREARHMSRGKGFRNWGTRVFLLVLAVLTALSVADFVALSLVDPKTFITDHSQVLEVELERGSGEGEVVQDSVAMLYNQFKSQLFDSGLDYEYIPNVSSKASISVDTVHQLGSLSMTLKNFSYAPLEYLEEGSLIMGRMPENPLEIVIDRWVLDAMLAEDGVLQNSIQSISYFLDTPVSFEKKELAPIIVGIADSNEPAVYMMDETYLSLMTNTMVVKLSTLQTAIPDKYSDLAFENPAESCYVLPENAGKRYYDMVGGKYNLGSQGSMVIAGALDETAFYADIIIADEMVDILLNKTSGQRFFVFCTDKSQAIATLYNVVEQMNNAVSITIYDDYVVTMNQYREESSVRADARTIVTATVILLSMVMLYLLRRSQVQDRIGMLSVYRLLGIPKYKTAGVFCLESLLDSLTVVLPAVLATWAVLLGLNAMPETQTEMILPLHYALLVGAGITVFHLIVTAVPLNRLLRLPPAQLASRYDF